MLEHFTLHSAPNGAGEFQDKGYKHFAPNGARDLE